MAHVGGRAVACVAREIRITGSLPFRPASLPCAPAGSPPHACGRSLRAPRRLRREQATAPLHPFARSKSPLCARQNRAGKTRVRLHATWDRPCVRLGARPMPEGVDPAPLVDFCNQNSPRAQPPISRSLAAAPGGCPPCAARSGGTAASITLPTQPLRADPYEPPLAGLRFRVGPLRAQPFRASRPASRPWGAVTASSPRGVPEAGLDDDANRVLTGQGPSITSGG